MTSKLTRDIIQSEIADFFAGVVEIHTELGGPNTVEEAQNQLTDRVLACVPEVDSEPMTNAQLPISRERLEKIHWAAKSLGNYCRADEIEALAAFALSVIDAQPAPVVQLPQVEQIEKFGDGWDSYHEDYYLAKDVRTALTTACVKWFSAEG